jgi:DNA topoisomerase II
MVRYSQKSIAQKIQVKNPREHILDSPGMWIGSVEPSKCQEYIYNETTKRMELKTVTVPHGLYKIFDEAIVNAFDHYKRLDVDNTVRNKVTYIKVWLDDIDNSITIENDGEGLDVKIHDTYKNDEGDSVYVPEIVFSVVFSSSNYDNKDADLEKKEEEEDIEGKLWGGKHGIGIKATNIFSSEFELETVDSVRKKKYVQLFQDNMSEIFEPDITKCRGKSYTKVRFIPDYAKFGIDGLKGDILDLIKTRVYELAGNCTEELEIWLNDEIINIKSFEDYGSMYLGAKKDNPRLYIKPNDRWDVIVAQSFSQKMEQISMVNFIKTRSDKGKHIEHVLNTVAKAIQTYVKTKARSKIDLPLNVIKDNIFLIIRCFIEDPDFDSQKKDEFTTPITKFNKNKQIKFSITEEQTKKIISATKIVEAAQRLNKFKTSEGTKNDKVRKTSNVRGIDKYEHAKFAGTRQSVDCTLCVCEGDSAKACLMSGRNVLKGDFFGIFPLKGKPLNTFEKTPTEVDKNDELGNIRKIMGLQFDKVYDDLSELNYGNILILTDQDEDGSHIKGLFIYFIKEFWPSLLQHEGFIRVMTTPLLQLIKGDRLIEFENKMAYENWLKTATDQHTWEHKFIKGLGGLETDDCVRLFSAYNDRYIKFNWTDQSADALDLAFHKKKADDRKVWLGGYDRNNIMDTTQRDTTYENFINQDLIHFSTYDNERSIPSAIDGQKTSMRKILYTCLSRKYKSNTKVISIGGAVIEHSLYHHGDASLYQTIIGLSQDFTGSNNINLLHPGGQMGSRLMGGKDFASPRYVETYIEPIAMKLIREEDIYVLPYRYEQGQRIEPDYFMPIIPLILVNGMEGIGTGYNTAIPAHNPLDIIDNVRRYINNEPMEIIYPWYRGFTGTIRPSESTVSGEHVHKFESLGIWSLRSNKLIIDELPISIWTTDYKAHLESLMEDPSKNDDKKEVKGKGKGKKKISQKIIVSYDDTKNTDTTIHIEIRLTPAAYEMFENDEEKMVDIMNLRSKPKRLNLNNMNMFNEDLQLKRYANTDEIFAEFCEIRRSYYQKRKDHMIKKLEREVSMADARARFILDFIENRIEIIRKEDDEIQQQLIDLEYPKFGKIDLYSMEESKPTYDYLLDMPIKSLTLRKIELLNKDIEEKTAEAESMKVVDMDEVWLDELDELETEYEYFMDHFERRHDGKSIKKMENRWSQSRRKKATSKQLKRNVKTEFDASLQFDVKIRTSVAKTTVPKRSERKPVPKKTPTEKKPTPRRKKTML